jgi:uncharacterized lipoprotein
MVPQRLKTPVAALLLAFGLNGCAWMLPDDPYMKTQAVKTLEVPSALGTPANDPNLVIPEGTIAETALVGGHRPPNAKVMDTLPEAYEKAQGEQAAPESEPAPKN